MATGARGWILWIALAIMCADSLVSLLPVVWELVTVQLRHNGALRLQEAADENDTSNKETETADRLVPTRWVLFGLAGSIVVGTLLIWIVFDEKPWATMIGFVVGSALSVLG
jgi:hypothetical protein